MTVSAFRRIGACRVVAAAAVLAGVHDLALAGDASSWDRSLHSQVRLIAGGAAHDAQAGAFRAGVEIRLDPGWKTYWRYPGDSGVPPRFDFARSENVRDVTVFFPAPTRFPDAAGSSIGYADHVILPLRVVPFDAGKPSVLRVALDYAVCEKLCLPVESRLELPLPRTATDADAALAASEARVPKPAAVAAGGPVSITAVRREPGPRHPRIVVDVAAPAASPVDLFAEGPTPDWALPLPEPVEGAPAGVHRFAFDLDGLPPGTPAAGASLKLTAVTAAAAIEVLARLD